MHRHRVFITAQYRVCGAGGGVVRMRGPRLWSPLAVVARAGAATSWDKDSGRAGRSSSDHSASLQGEDLVTSVTMK